MSVILVIQLLLTALSHAGSTGLASLTGTVLNPQGEPVSGALVVLNEGKLSTGFGGTCAYITPEVGGKTGSHCAMCQVDRGHFTRSNRQGEFSFHGLDVNHEHMIAINATGFQPLFTWPIVVPAEGQQFRLSPLTKERKTFTLSGMILDEEGNPISNATVLPVGIRTEEGTRWRPREVDKITLSDNYGRFHLNSDVTPLALYLRIKARGYAPRVIVVEPKDEPVRIGLTRGVTLSGKIVGRTTYPMKVGIVGAERHPSLFLGERFVSTDFQGNFQFRNLSPGAAYVVFTPIFENPMYDELAEALPSTWIQLPKPGDGDEVDMGKLELLRASRVTGRVTLAHQTQADHHEELLEEGGETPDGLFLLVSRISAWDIQEVPVRSDGSFKFFSPPGESVKISLRYPGYSFSHDAPGYNPFDPWQLAGRVNQHLKNFVIPLKPGKNERNPTYREDVPRSQWPENTPFSRTSNEK